MPNLTPLEQEMLAALKRMEWSASIAGFSACPQCVATKGNGHKLDCFLAGAIAKAEPKPHESMPCKKFCSVGGDNPLVCKNCGCGSLSHMAPKPTTFKFEGIAAQYEWSTRSWKVPVERVREIKPITQEQVTAALSPAYSICTERAKYVNFLRNLGIDVED